MWLWQIVDKTIMEADKDRDGKISFEEFTKMVENTDVSMSMTLGKSAHATFQRQMSLHCPPSHRPTLRLTDGFALLLISLADQF